MSNQMNNLNYILITYWAIYNHIPNYHDSRRTCNLILLPSCHLLHYANSKVDTQLINGNYGVSGRLYANKFG